MVHVQSAVVHSDYVLGLPLREGQQKVHERVVRDSCEEERALRQTVSVCFVEREIHRRRFALGTAEIHGQCVLGAVQH